MGEKGEKHAVRLTDRDFVAIGANQAVDALCREVDELKVKLAEAEQLRKQAVEVAALRAVEIASVQGEAAAMRRALEYGIKELSAYFESCGRPGQTPKLHKVLERLRAALQQKGGS